MRSHTRRNASSSNEHPVERASERTNASVRVRVGMYTSSKVYNAITWKAHAGCLQETSRLNNQLVTESFWPRRNVGTSRTGRSIDRSMQARCITVKRRLFITARLMSSSVMHKDWEREERTQQQGESLPCGVGSTSGHQIRYVVTRRCLIQLGEFLFAENRKLPASSEIRIFTMLHRHRRSRETIIGMLFESALRTNFFSFFQRELGIRITFTTLSVNTEGFSARFIGNIDVLSGISSLSCLSECRCCWRNTRRDCHVRDVAWETRVKARWLLRLIKSSSRSAVRIELTSMKDRRVVVVVFLLLLPTDDISERRCALRKSICQTDDLALESIQLRRRSIRSYVVSRVNRVARVEAYE